MGKPRNQLRRFLAVILAPLGFAAPFSAADFGDLGERLEQAKTTPFFDWFHLEETGVTRANGNALVSFKPSGKKFHDLATVKVTTDARDRILAIELVLDRSFIDDPRDGIFARDIAKSFLLAGLPELRDPEVMNLINEIQYRGTSTMPVLKGPTRAPRLPERPTPGYLTYLGQQPSYEHRLPGLLLRLENGKEGPAALVLSIRGQS